jgi:hypothetical protein
MNPTNNWGELRCSGKWTRCTGSGTKYQKRPAQMLSPDSWLSLNVDSVVPI